jgi:hypothetical protein
MVLVSADEDNKLHLEIEGHYYLMLLYTVMSNFFFHPYSNSCGPC